MKSSARALCKACALGCVLGASALPACADDLDDWLAGDYATGNWGGLRDNLEEKGIIFEGGYTTDLLTLARGGESGGEGWSYAGRVDLGVGLDLEKLVGLTGGSIFATAGWSTGQDLSEKDVGNTFPVAQIFTGQSFRLGELYYQQKLLEDELTLKFGRLTTEVDFLASDIYANYVNGGINGTPFPMPDSNLGFTTAPFAQWGTVAVYDPNDAWRGAIGFYNANDKVGEDKRHGIDFVLDPGDNMLMVGEVDYLWNNAEDDTGLPGVVKFGGLYETGNRDELPDGGSSKKGNYGFYTSIEQQVYREPGDGNQGLTPWAVITYQPRQSVAQLPVFLGTGLVYTGLIPTRDTDTAAIGFLYGTYSKRIDGVSSEKVLELTYTAQLTPFFYVRPDLQFIFDPSGSSHISNAIVAGGEIGIVF